MILSAYNVLKRDHRLYKGKQIILLHVFTYLTFLLFYKVAELQELIQMMPDKQKLALWDYWDAAQKFVNSCFKNLMMDISIPEKDEHIDACM